MVELNPQYRDNNLQLVGKIRVMNASWNVLIVALLLCNCPEPVPDDCPVGAWSIYRLRDSTLTAYEASRKDIDELVLADEPFISIRDLSLDVRLLALMELREKPDILLSAT